MSPEDAAAQRARLFGTFARLWDHYWEDHRGTRVSFTQYASGSRTGVVLVAVPEPLERLLPAVEWVNERGEIRVRPETGDLPPLRWWGQWSGLRLLPRSARWGLSGLDGK